MIPALVVPVLARPELLYGMLATIDHSVDHLIVIDNGDCVDDEMVAASAGHGVLTERVSVIHMPANLGVAGSWNLGIKAAPFAPWWLICNFDVRWPVGSLAALCDIAERNRVTLTACAPPWAAFALGDLAVSQVGLFDERLHPAYFEDNDWQRRADAAGVPVYHSSVPVDHHNSSTLKAGYEHRNSVTFADNHAWYHSKVERGDLSDGWSLSRRRRLSWD